MDKIDSGLQGRVRCTLGKTLEQTRPGVSSCHSSTAFSQAFPKKVGHACWSYIFGSGAGHNHNIQRGRRQGVLGMPKPFTKPPFDAIPHGGFPIPLLHHKPQAMVRQAVRGYVEHKRTAGKAPTFLAHPLKFPGLFQAFRGTKGIWATWCGGRHDRPVFFTHYTDRRLRPLARLRLITARPDLVAMRTRNPWVRFRRRLCG